MRKIMMLLVIVSLSAGGAVYAGDNGGFWETLLKKINKLSSRSVSQETPTSVVGVRGAQDKDSDSLYWKGKAEKPVKGKEATVSEKEVAEFKKAVQMAAEGQKEAARKAFKEFMVTYPDSRLIEDAEKALKRLKNASAPKVPSQTASPQ